MARRNRHDSDALAFAEQYEIEQHLARCTYRYRDMAETCDRISGLIDEIGFDFRRLTADLNRQIGNLRWQAIR